MNVIGYRLPGSKEIVIFEVGKGRLAQFQKGRMRFLVCPFNPSLGITEYDLIRSLDYIPSRCIEENYRNFIFNSTTKEYHSQYIATIQNFLAGDQNRKIVAARCLKINRVTDINHTFEALAASYPNAFVFFISTSEFGSWIGATPELLLEKEGNRLTSMALAGTRKAMVIDEEWDEKNIREQMIVTDYIVNIFKKYAITTQYSGPDTYKAGPVEHLCSMIEGTIPEGTDIKLLLHSLSPTPALAGFPRKESLDIIQKMEGDRGLYGGFCGPMQADGDFRLNVILRCAYLGNNESIVFAGGGITVSSVADDEWTETENKLATLLKFF